MAGRTICFQRLCGIVRPSRRASASINKRLAAGIDGRLYVLREIGTWHWCIGSRRRVVDSYLRERFALDLNTPLPMSPSTGWLERIIETRVKKQA